MKQQPKYENKILPPDHDLGRIVKSVQQTATRKPQTLQEMHEEFNQACSKLLTEKAALVRKAASEDMKKGGNQ